MSTLSLIVLSIGLAMDAFAVAVCKGLAMKKWSGAKAVTVGLYFGVFQAVMPIIGYLLGASFSGKIEAVDHWIAFVLLVLIGGKMVKESFSHEEECASDDTSFKAMSVLAIATSIDALAMGISFAFLKVNIIEAAAFIGIITFVLSAVGVKIGNVFGAKYKSKAELCGGVILIILGLKILIEHMM